LAADSCRAGEFRLLAEDDKDERSGLGLMLFEPAGHVKHFSDVVAGATADAMWFFGDADEYGIHIQ
jgi:hypothetical protein